jgi:hypothetical protein
MLPSRLAQRHLLNGMQFPHRIDADCSRSTKSGSKHSRTLQPIPTTKYRIHPGERSRVHHRRTTETSSHQSTFVHLSASNFLVLEHVQQNHRCNLIRRLFICRKTDVIGVYCFGAAYLVSPLFGWHLDVPTLVATFGSLPVAAKLGIKSVVAFPFAFHSINGLRHLTWDAGAGISLQFTTYLSVIE